jgi:hypothetical protein
MASRWRLVFEETGRRTGLLSPLRFSRFLWAAGQRTSDSSKRLFGIISLHLISSPLISDFYRQCAGIETSEFRETLIWVSVDNLGLAGAVLDGNLGFPGFLGNPAPTQITLCVEISLQKLLQQNDHHLVMGESYPGHTGTPIPDQSYGQLQVQLSRCYCLFEEKVELMQK